MKNSSLAGTLVTLAIIGGCGYFFKTQIEESYVIIKNIIIPPVPCSQPIRYTIGTFDPQFGISQDEFIKDIDTAAHIWETPFNRTFFQYAGASSTLTGPFNFAANNVMTINLLYDYRQQATNEMSDINTTITSDTANYDNLKDEYDSLNTQYTSQKAALASDIANFNSQKDAYTRQLQSWQSQGSPDNSEYANLETERQQLNAEAATVNQAEASLNLLINQINPLAAELNSTVQGLNSNVDQYNAIGSETGGSFEEGDFIQDGTTKQINIYQYDDEDKLIRVLAHELGHSLGMQHVKNPAAIMYAVNEGAGGTLTQDDIDELKRVCDIM